MRHIIILAAATSLLAVAACTREPDTAPAMDDTAMSDAAMSADQAASDASDASTTASRSSNAGGTSAASAGETMDAEASGMTDASGTGPTGTERDYAAEEARAASSNLHPTTPAN